VSYSRLRDRSRALLWPFVFVYLKSGVHPNFITLLGLVLSLLTGYFYRMGLFLHAAVGLLFSGICDATDGEVARRTGKTTKLGAFLDSVLDRYSEIFIYFGLFLYYLRSTTVIVVVLGLTGSLMVSYVRARSEALGQECKSGLLLRPERLSLLFIGSLFGAEIFVYFLIAIAVLSNFTAIHRIYSTWRKISAS
jgi:CDP-diacylglycerol--glycerol-3-phosphate 3-phosphatidyltransferase